MRALRQEADYRWAGRPPFPEDSFANGGVMRIAPLMFAGPCLIVLATVASMGQAEELTLTGSERYDWRVPRPILRRQGTGRWKGLLLPRTAGERPGPKVCLEPLAPAGEDRSARTSSRDWRR